MSEGQLFFYLKDISTLIKQATTAGGTDLGIVITPATDVDKPILQVSYFIKSEGDLSFQDVEQFTDPVIGCPYPPRC